MILNETIDPIVYYLIGITVGYILARLMQVIQRIRIASFLSSRDTLLCDNATVIQECTGEIAWYDNDRIKHGF